MNNDFDAIFEPGSTSTNEEPITAMETSEAANEADELQVDEVAEPAAEAVETPAQPAESEDKAAEGRLAAMLDTRDKLKEAQRELEELRRREAERQTAAQAQTEFPDPYADPDGFRQAVQREVEAKLVRQRFEFDRSDCHDKFGKDATEDAIQWAISRAASDPTFEQTVGAQTRPINWIISQHKRQVELNDFEADREAFIRREAAKLGLLGATPVESLTAAPVTIDGRKNTAPRSLASVTSSTTKTKSTTAAEDFNSIFEK